MEMQQDMFENVYIPIPLNTPKQSKSSTTPQLVQPYYQTFTFIYYLIIHETKNKE